MRAALLLAATGVVLAASLAAGCSRASATTGAALVSQRCSRCHALDRIRAARHDPAGWEATVARMRNVHGARLSDAEARQVIEFLVGGGASQL